MPLWTMKYIHFHLHGQFLDVEKGFKYNHLNLENKIYTKAFITAEIKQTKKLLFDQANLCHSLHDESVQLKEAL